MKTKTEDKKIIVTLDLTSKEGTKPDYRVLDKLMAVLGLSHNSPRKGVKFPYNTYYGTISYTVRTFRQNLWQSLKKKNLHPTALFGGELRAWGTKRIPKKKRTPPRARVKRRTL